MTARYLHFILILLVVLTSSCATISASKFSSIDVAPIIEPVELMYRPAKYSVNRVMRNFPAGSRSFTVKTNCEEELRYLPNRNLKFSQTCARSMLNGDDVIIEAFGELQPSGSMSNIALYNSFDDQGQMTEDDWAMVNSLSPSISVPMPDEIRDGMLEMYRDYYEINNPIKTGTTIFERGDFSIGVDARDGSVINKEIVRGRGVFGGRSVIVVDVVILGLISDPNTGLEDYKGSGVRYYDEQSMALLYGKTSLVLQKTDLKNNKSKTRIDITSNISQN